MGISGPFIKLSPDPHDVPVPLIHAQKASQELLVAAAPAITPPTEPTVPPIAVTTTPAGGGASTSVVFPIYDGHGNEIATLARSGSWYSISNVISYGAWGEIRQRALNGGPRSRYCGNLGHIQDDETGLSYQRSRYYESGTGRYISSDPAHSGSNWFSYCSANPVNLVDSSGKEGEGGLGGEGAEMGIDALLGECTETLEFNAGGMNFLAEVENLSESQLTVYIGYAEGDGTGVNVAGAINEARSACDGLAQIVIRFNLRQFGQGSYRFAPIVKRAMQAIQRLGDSGELMHDDDMSYIYWMFDD